MSAIFVFRDGTHVSGDTPVDQDGKIAKSTTRANFDTKEITKFAFQGISLDKSIYVQESPLPQVAHLAEIVKLLRRSMLAIKCPSLSASETLEGESFTLTASLETEVAHDGSPDYRVTQNNSYEVN